MADSNLLKRCDIPLENTMPPTTYQSPPPRPAEIHIEGRTTKPLSSCHGLLEWRSADAQPAVLTI